MAMPRVIDLDDAPELASLADEVTATRRTIVLRKRGKDLALVVPIDDPSRFAPGRLRTPEDLEAFLRSAGGWRGVVDEEFMDEVYRSRSTSSRPPVDL
jgi:hypothetical protein